MELLATDWLIKASLIFIRISGLVFVMPIFGDQSVPLLIKIVFTLCLTAALYQFVPDSYVNIDSVSGVATFCLLVIKELGVGLAIGFVTTFIFDGIVMAASLVGYQMGFGTANLLLPGSDIRANAFTAFHRSVVLLIFLSLGFHHQLIYSMVKSFEVVSSGSRVLSDSLVYYAVSASPAIFSTALQLATPILVAVLLATLALGIIARSVPQLNVFTLSFPISFFAGLITYMLAISFYPDWLKDFYSRQLTDILGAISGYAKG